MDKRDLAWCATRPSVRLIFTSLGLKRLGKWIVGNSESLWMIVSFICAPYVFLGIAPAVYYLYYSRWVLGGLFSLVYVLNLVLLSYANKRW